MFDEIDLSHPALSKEEPDHVLIAQDISWHAHLPYNAWCCLPRRGRMAPLAEEMLE
jgi:hypothetical protein